MKQTSTAINAIQKNFVYLLEIKIPIPRGNFIELGLCCIIRQKHKSTRLDYQPMQGFKAHSHNARRIQKWKERKAKKAAEAAGKEAVVDDKKTAQTQSETSKRKSMCICALFLR